MRRCLLNPEWTCRDSTHKVGPPTPRGYFEEGARHSRPLDRAGRGEGIRRSRNAVGSTEHVHPVLRRVSSELGLRRCTPTLPGPFLA